MVLIELKDVYVTNEIKKFLNIEIDVFKGELLPLSKERIISTKDVKTPIKVDVEYKYPYIPKYKLAMIGKQYLLTNNDIDMNDPINSPTITYTIIDGRHRVANALIHNKTTINADINKTVSTQYHTYKDAIMEYIKTLT